MLTDLRSILDGWEYKPGKISVRKIVGEDGGEKIQTRVDLGVLQLEPEGRPDGARPFGCESLLEFYETRLDEHLIKHGTDAGYILLPEDCRDLRQEAHLYYQRFLSLFVLGDFIGVQRDTQRNMRVLTICHEYGETDYDRGALEPQRAYVMMMFTRAKTYAELEIERYDEALKTLAEGMREIAEVRGGPEHDEDTGPDDDLECDAPYAVLDSDSEPGAGSSTGIPELEVLAELREEVLTSLPEDAAPRLEWELNLALECEEYERAAELRRKLDDLFGRGEQT